MHNKLRSIVFLFCLIFSSIGHAATYHVATTGSNAVACGSGGTGAQNPATPKQTIANGITCLAAGDTLYIHAGTYAEQLLDSFNMTFPSGTSSSPITIASYSIVIGGTSATIRPAPGASSFAIGMDSTTHVVQYLIFNNLIIDNINNDNTAVKLGIATSNIKILNSVIKNTRQSGILTGGSNSQFTNLDIFNTGIGGEGHGFYITGANNIVENCLLHDMEGIGVQLYNGNDGGAATNNIIRNNKIWNTGQNSLNRTLGAMILGSGANNIAYNNLIWNNQSGIAINHGNVNGTVLYNNTIYNNRTKTGECIAVVNGTGLIIRNNICWQNIFDNIVEYGSASYTQSNNLFNGVNPLFVNAGAADFHLLTGSPAIDTGFNTNATNPIDFSGTAFTIPKEIGAYNFGTVVGPLVMIFTTPPTGTVEDRLIPAVTVCVNDTAGVRQTGHTNPISLAIGTNPASGTLTGGGGIVPINGCSQFSSMSINNPSVDPYTLVASSTGVTSQTSMNFLIFDDADPIITAPQRLMLQRAS